MNFLVHPVKTHTDHVFRKTYYVHLQYAESMTDKAAIFS